MTTDRLAALLHGMDVCLQNPSDHDDYCSDLAARLAAAGVTVAPQPAPDEPSCCELACYEDPGCACDGCQPAATPAPALDVERIVRQTLGHVMSRVRLDLMAGAIDQTYSPAEVAVMVRQAAEAAAIARAYEEEEGR